MENLVDLSDSPFNILVAIYSLVLHWALPGRRGGVLEPEALNPNCLGLCDLGCDVSPTDGAVALLSVTPARRKPGNYKTKRNEAARARGLRCFSCLRWDGPDLRLSPYLPSCKTQITLWSASPQKEKRKDYIWPSFLKSLEFHPLKISLWKFPKMCILSVFFRRRKII